MDVRSVARQLLAAGFSVLPTKADGSKAPKLPAWKKLTQQRLSQSEADSVFSDECGIAVIGGAISGNLECLDIDDGELVAEFEQRLAAELPGILDRINVTATPRQENGGRHYRYRVAGEVSGNTILARDEKMVALIETRGTGGYALVPGGNPAAHSSGLPYRHISGPILEHVDTITESERDRIHFVARTFNRIVPATNGTHDHHLGESRPGDDFNARASWPEILSAHGWRPCGNDAWTRPGKQHGVSATTCCRSAGGNSLLAVFTSNAHPLAGPDNGKPCSTYSKFAAYAILNHGGDYAAAATELALKGYGSPPESTDVDLGGILRPSENGHAEQPIDELGEFPAELLSPPGILAEMIQYALDTAAKPQPELAVGSTLALLSVLTGRKISFQGFRTNLYIIGLLESCGGKNALRTANKRMLKAAGAGSLIGPSGFTSAPGIITKLVEHPAMLFQIDELGDVLRSMKIAGANGGSMGEIASELKELYTSPDDESYAPNAYADSKKNQVIHCPHCVMFGTSTEQVFWNSLSLNNITDGFLGRAIIVPGRPDVIGRDLEDDHAVPESIVEFVRYWHAHPPSAGIGGNEKAVVKIQATPDAKERLREYRKIVDKKRVGCSEINRAIWGRAGEKAAKCAMLFAVSRCVVEEVVIELDDVNLAIKFVNWTTRFMMRESRFGISENDYHRHKMRILRHIRDAGPDGLSRGAIGDRNDHVKSKDRGEILKDLAETGAIEVGQRVAKNGAAVQFFFCP